MSGQERRRHPRATVELIAGEICAGKLFLPLLSDISADGVLMASPSGLEMPATHAPVVELMLPGVSAVIYARCRLLRETHHGFFRTRALQFVDIAPIDRMHIRQYIQRVCGLC